VALVLLLDLHPAAPPDPPHGSLVAWVVAAGLLAVVVVVGLALASRR